MTSINGDKMDGTLPGSLQGLSQSLEARSHLLAGPGDEDVAALALQATKSIFDLGLALESQSHPHLHPFLLSVLQPPTIALRSSTIAKSKAPPPPPQPKPEEVLPYTPLSELTVVGLESEQIWAQLELRADGICKAVGEVAAPEEEDEEGGDDESTDDEEDGSDEDISIEEFKKMMMEQGEEYDSDEIEAMFGDRGSDDSEDEEGDSDEEEDDDEDDEEDSEDDEEDEDSGDEEDSDIADEVDWEDDEDAARFAELEGEVPGSEEEDEEDEEDDDNDEEEEDDEEDDDDLPEGDDEGSVESENDEEDALFGQAGPSRSRPRHPTLDDDFFSIDDFNRLTEQQEAGRVSGGRLGGDEDDDDEELGDVSELMLRGGDEDSDVMYGDFFAPPRSAPAAGKKGKGKAGPAAKGKGKDKGKGKGKGVQFADDDDDEDMDRDEDEEGGEASGVMGRVKGDLFDSDDEDGAEGQNLSTHEKQQLALAKQIAELEQQAVGPKDWTLLGEASARARPENSLLEEDLDFEQVGKVVPVITEDVVKSLEDLIKQRIIDNNFDSVVRVRAYEPTAFLPSRYFELQDTRSTQSLAQIYEDEYQAAASGSARVDARDAKLSAEHEEIDRIWGEICYKLDALSSLHFVPKAPKAQITTVANLPTASLESALPPTATSATLMAPEEVAAPAGAKELVSRSELTPEEKQRARQKKRKHRQAEGKRLEELAELYGKKRKSAKEEKEDALKSLVKGGKGVTIVGKGAKESGKAQKRASGSGDREDGKRLKL